MADQVFSATSELQPYACMRCKSRKISCDRLNPACTKCRQSDVECEYKAPPPPNRRKRKVDQTDLETRLRQYEDLLRDKGVHVDSYNHAPKAASQPAVVNGVCDRHLASPSVQGSTPRQQPNNGTKVAETDPATIIVHREYVDHKGQLWQDLKEVGVQESRPEDDSLEEDDEAESQSGQIRPSDGSDLALGFNLNVGSYAVSIPPADMCLRLWQIYKENVNPLSNVMHVPSTDRILNGALNSLNRPDDATRALIFALCLAACITITTEECETLFNEPRDTLVARYNMATKQALVKAGLVSTKNVDVLKAFTIFLTTSQTLYTPDAIWTLTGLALRIGKRLRLHKREHPSLTVFQIEMQKRLWWQLCMLDFHFGEIAGQGDLGGEYADEVDVPLNINDEDLEPDQVQLPPEHSMPTQMMFCRIRYEFGIFVIKGLLRQFNQHGVITQSQMRDNLAEKDKIVEDLEHMLESKYLRYCDPLLPLHTLCMVMVRCVISRMKVMAHHPRQYVDRGVNLPSTEREFLWNNSLRTLEYDTIIQSNPNVRCFQWHTRHQVQYVPLVYILIELKTRTTGADADNAWNEIGKIYGNHTEMLQTKDRPLFQAIARLLLAAWAMRQPPPATTPPYIMSLQSRRRTSKQRSQSQAAAYPRQTELGSLGDAYNNLQPSLSLTDGSLGTFDNDFDFSPGVGSSNGFSPIDWGAWDVLVNDWQGQTNQMSVT